MAPDRETNRDATGADLSRFVRQLASGATWGEAGSPVELIETHISWVALTPQYAYKVRKPVRFDFVDFSTLDRRRQDCIAEVELNRRLAPDVYLGVHALVEGPAGTLQLDGPGTPCEWVVKMRRLPADSSLDERIKHQRLSDAEIRQTARMLTRFYQQLAPEPINAADYRRSVETHVRDNRTELLKPEHELPREIVQRVHTAQLLLLHIAPELLDERASRGRIIEGHGDLRPEHIYLAPEPVVIDCVEFHREFRVLDVLDELAFLAMECNVLGAEHVGRAVLDEYRQTTGDCPPVQLEAFYRCYRACVRAKVHALRARQLEGAARERSRHKAATYLRQADAYAAGFDRPVMLLVRGVSGSGKTTLALAAAERYGLEHLSTDLIRKELFGAAAGPAQLDQNVYSPHSRERVYGELARRADELLEQRVSVVVDGTFLDADSRALLIEVAKHRAAVPLIIHGTCPIEVAQQRIRDRAAAGPQSSDAWPELVAIQAEREQPDRPEWPSCSLDMRRPITELFGPIDAALRREVNRMCPDFSLQCGSPSPAP